MKRLFCSSRKCLAAILCLLAVMVMSFAACTQRADYISRSFFAMDTIIEVKLAADTSNADEIFTECIRLTEETENMLSAENGESEISRFNMSSRGCEVSREVGELFELSVLIWRASNGAFDPTTYPSTLLWRSAAESGTLPSDDELSAAVAKRGMELIKYDSVNGFLSKSEPWVMLDFGGIGKGYVEEQIAEYLDDRVEYGVLSFGGNITVIGEHPSGAFTIALRDPHNLANGNSESSIGYAGRILIKIGFVSVSGGYERYYEIDGEHFCHILDPASGMPVNGKIQSTAVISQNGAAADALSTALFVSDSISAVAELYEALSDTPLAFEAILVYESETYITPGLGESFTAEGTRTLGVINAAV